MLGTEAMVTGIVEEFWRFLVTLYADNNLVKFRCSVELQSYIDILVTLFERVGLRTNVTKTNTMVCVLGWIRTCQS